MTHAEFDDVCGKIIGHFVTERGALGLYDGPHISEIASRLNVRVELMQEFIALMESNLGKDAPRSIVPDAAKASHRIDTVQ